MIDRVGGASMGSFIGALFACGLDVDEIEARCYQEFVRRNPIGDYCLPLDRSPAALGRGRCSSATWTA